MDKLFLLNPDFIDNNSKAKEQKYFCPPCAFLPGMLNFYPKLKEQLEVIFVDYEKPVSK